MRRYPSLYQINTRGWLRQLSSQMGQPATLVDIPEGELDDLAEAGFDWIWFLGVWQTGAASRHATLAHPGLRKVFENTLCDLEEFDIAGSCFAIKEYTVHSDFGGNPALEHLRKRLHERGLRLMLDFVPNHTALDHPWVREQPAFYVQGSPADLEKDPQNFSRVGSSLVLAHGRDPHFPAWTDTLQLNHGNPELQEAMKKELLRTASVCDGLRCDMAMLILPEVFQQTWGIRSESFWPDAIKRVRRAFPEFLFMAEVYWDLEWKLQHQGFDYTYDKRLYDRLSEKNARPVREHLRAGLDYQDRMARFLENHDEPRAAAVFPFEVHKAAAVVTYLTPGLRFFHQGQLEGFKVGIPVQLSRGPVERLEAPVKKFYDDLLTCLRVSAVREGDWRLLDCIFAWEGNWTWDCFIAWAWRGKDGRLLLVVVNYAPNQSQCYITLPFDELKAGLWRLKDMMSPAAYERDGDDLLSWGLYVDMPPWGFHVFELSRIG